jgi:hypothetical protein
MMKFELNLERPDPKRAFTPAPQPFHSHTLWVELIPLAPYIFISDIGPSPKNLRDCNKYCINFIWLDQRSFYRCLIKDARQCKRLLLAPLSIFSGFWFSSFIFINVSEI